VVFDMPTTCCRPVAAGACVHAPPGPGRAAGSTPRASRAAPRRLAPCARYGVPAWPGPSKRARR
jgi:hypothetical protein